MFIIFSVICLILYLFIVTSTIISKYDKEPKFKIIKPITAVMYLVAEISICLGISCLDLQFLINKNNEYLSALYPLIALLLQFALLKLLWEAFNYKLPRKVMDETGKIFFIVCLLISILFMVIVLWQNRAKCLVWIQCLEYPVVSLLSIWISPDLAFKEEKNEKC